MSERFTFGRTAPTVAVRDMARAREFYGTVLGFETTFQNGDPIRFAILERDAAELHLTLDPEHVAASHNVMHMLVDDATALHQHLVDRGVQIVKALRDADYGVRGFVFADPDDNRIDVGQTL